MNLGQIFTYISLAYIALLGTLFILFFALFIPGELIMLHLRRRGYTTARTLSQYVIKLAKEGNPFFKNLIIWMPVAIGLAGIFLALTGTWLIFHFEAFCINWGVLCNIDI